jgi:hypothetical protein
VRPPQHNTKPFTLNPGLPTTLRAILQGQESGVQSPRPHHWARFLAALAVFALATVLPSPSALASSGSANRFEFTGPESPAALSVPPPKFKSELYFEEVFSTRAHIVAVAELSVTEKVEDEWQAEYAPAETDGSAPPPPKVPDEAPWKLEGEGKDSEALIYMALRPNNEQPVFSIVHHLSPATKYFARFTVKDAGGFAEKEFSFTTLPIAKPEVAKVLGDGQPTTFQVNASGPRSGIAEADVESNGAVAEYSFEYALAKGAHCPVESSASWQPFTSADASGTITVAEDFVAPKTEVIGLVPETTYCARVKVKNEKGSTIQTEAAGDENGTFVTPTEKPLVYTPETDEVTGMSAHVAASLVPHGLETHWRFEYAISETLLQEGKGQAGPEGTVTAEQAAALPENVGAPGVEGTISGLSPGTTYYVRLTAESSAGKGEYCTEPQSPNSEPLVCEDDTTTTRGEASFEALGTPPTATTLATHALHGEAVRVLGAVDTHTITGAHFHFQYVPRGEYEEPGTAGGFAQAAGTPEEPLGTTPETVGQDLPPLTPDETYFYRLVVTSTAPGHPVVDGEQQTLTAPVLPVVAEESCPNQALRIGPSASLPDCRAYEQVTPVDKEGSKEAFTWDGLKAPAFALVGEDGDHVMVDAQAVQWGAGPTGGQSPYFFSRTPEGWQMTAATVQPEAGIETYTPQVLSPSLTGLGFESAWATTLNSPDVQFKSGPPGGPYATVATVPRSETHGGEGWVAASTDFSKLILQVEDHELVEPRTSTTSGSDLYEYSGGILRQVNVGIGTCGAMIVRGNEGSGSGSHNGAPSPHAVSADGSEVFFEAVPGHNCSAPKHLYGRIDGTETVDLGVYRFAAANADGSELLLEKAGGENPGLYLYRPGSPPAFLSSTGLATSSNFNVSEDLSTVYFNAGGDISHYDVATESLGFVAHVEQRQFKPFVSRDGRYYYFNSPGVAGVPGGATDTRYEKGGGGEAVVGPTMQVYRYDSLERTIECVSCASPTDPEPKLDVNFSENAASFAPGGTPRLVFASDDGDFVFFQTAAALVLADVNEEVLPEGTSGAGAHPSEHASDENSVSGDVYEWRRAGVDRCGHVQGCLALITTGQGSGLNEIVGTAEEGRDVFIYTPSQLVKQDNDAAGDIYDARVDGGFPEPTSPVECNGDNCNTPFSPPSDASPSSASFHGVGNLLPAAAPAPRATKPKPKKKAVKKRKRKKSGKRAEKSAKGRK